MSKFKTIIYYHIDEENNEHGVWVKMSSSQWGGVISIATFKEQPTEETPDSEAITSFCFDPCFAGVSKITAWDEYSDPSSDNGTEMILVASIDDWKPREQEEDSPVS
jgi:hypothetical protein